MFNGTSSVANLGTNMNGNALTMIEVWIVEKDKVTLSMEVEPSTEPCHEMRFTTAVSFGSVGTL